MRKDPREILVRIGLAVVGALRHRQSNAAADGRIDPPLLQRRLQHRGEVAHLLVDRSGRIAAIVGEIIAEIDAMSACHQADIGDPGMVFEIRITAVLSSSRALRAGLPARS